MLDRVEPSNDNRTKYVARFSNGRSTRFGAAGMDDYTITHDEAQRARYRSRHARDLKTNDPYRAGYLSYYLLWGDSTSIRKNIRDYNARFF